MKICALQQKCSGGRPLGVRRALRSRLGFRVAATRTFWALVMSLGLFSSGGCLKFVESPWDSSTLFGFALQWYASRVPFALGQNDAYSVYGVERGFNAPAGMTIFGDSVYVVDRDNKRVLRFAAPATNHEPASLALGQPGTSNSLQQVFNYPVSAATMDRPMAVATDGLRVAVADTQRHRVLLWLTPPTYSGQPADVVLGQPDVTSILPATAVDRMNTPQGVALCQNRLYVADSSNNRVLIFAPIPTVTGAAASAVLGQADFVTSAAGAVAATSMSSPGGIYCDGTTLYVPDSGYHRILIWTAAPTTIAAPADVAVGQPNLGTGGLVGASATSLNTPQGVFARSGALAIADSGNNRVLFHNAIPSASGAAADRVFGQSNMTAAVTAAAGTYNVGLDAPSAVALDSAGRLYAVDRNLERVVIWKAPTASTAGAPVDLVLGQPTASEKPAKMNPGAGPFRLFGPTQLSFSGDRMFLATASHSRILGWHTIPTFRATFADFVLGQPDFNTVTDDNTIGTSATTLDLAAGVCTNGTQLFISDTDNHRLLVWNALPTVTQAAPDFVLGQANFTASLANGGAATSQNTLSSPGGIYCDSQRIIVGDPGNNRVLIWNLPITANGQNANRVLGQLNFTTAAAAGGQNGLNQPGPPPILADGRLFVADTGNHRILVWNSLPTADGQNADLVIGQPDFTVVASNGGGAGPSANYLNTPQGLMIMYGRLFISDFFNSRILAWRSLPTINGQAADYVIGQDSFTTSLPNAGRAVGPMTFFGTGLLAHYGDRVFIGDSFNQRVVVLEDRHVLR